MMRIAVLLSSYRDSSASTKDFDETYDPTPYLAGHQVEVHPIHKSTAVRQVTDLTRRGFDMFLNLCDGAWDEDRAGVEVVHALELANVAFTGADSAFYEPSRERMKLACYASGLRTPLHVLAAGAADVEEAAELLRFPLIVKHPNSYNSIGLTRDSLVHTPSALEIQAERMMARFGSTLIEEFVVGREFTVLVAENPDDPSNPVVYSPAEVVFPEGESFKHFDLKWVSYQEAAYRDVADPVLRGRIEDASRRFFLGLKGTGFGRCDLRLGEDNELYMLEMNPNCGVFYAPENPGSADYILLHDPAGHQGFVDLLLRAAERRRRPPAVYKVRATRSGDYGLYAQRRIREGEIIVRYEESPFNLVTRKHVLATWSADRMKDFREYAYPLTDEIYVMWSEDPFEWKPINHSCDPNAWLTGLDLTARRQIVKGEQITVDYATFCNESMQEFRCRCGQPTCRGMIRGNEYAQPFLAAYGDHVSEYIAGKRRSLRR